MIPLYRRRWLLILSKASVSKRISRKVVHHEVQDTRLIDQSWSGSLIRMHGSDC